jgi:ATP-dependent Clp protease adaptor protein ClpS
MIVPPKQSRHSQTESPRGEQSAQRFAKASGPSTAPAEVDLPSTGQDVRPDRPWLVIVWNDPINLMTYVTYVFQKLFGYSREKATRLMLDVHHKGRAVVSSGPRERAELDVVRLHEHGLWATLEQSQ